MLIQLKEEYLSENHAGPKAQRDISMILQSCGWEDFRVFRISSNGAVKKTLGRVLWFVMAQWYRMRLPRKSVLLLQYPGVSFANNATFCLLNEKDKKKRKYKLIVLVHDLKNFRDGHRCLCPNESRLFALADVVILHNEAMVSAVASCGVVREKLVPLECFDYLAEGPDEIVRERNAVVNVAGNLSVARSGWMRGVGALKGIRWKMFGAFFEPREYGNGDFEYGGSVTPEVLPEKLADGFGLIWYSEIPESVSGKIIDYIRIINPHKLSLYLRAGLPVIVWDEAAVAPFVRKYGVGISVRELSEIPQRISEIDEESYARMAVSARRLGKGLQQGEFTKKAVDAALGILSER